MVVEVFISFYHLNKVVPACINLRGLVSPSRVQAFNGIFSNTLCHCLVHFVENILIVLVFFFWLLFAIMMCM